MTVPHESSLLICKMGLIIVPTPLRVVTRIKSVEQCLTHTFKLVFVTERKEGRKEG